MNAKAPSSKAAARRAPTDAATAPAVGIGLRQPHYAEFAERRPALGFVEVHSENFFAAGGAALAVLRGVRASHAVSLHGVGLALGSAVGIDDWHLDKLCALVDAIEPVRVSDHACFARAAWRPEASARPELVHASDLLPIAFTPASLDILCDNVDRVQQRLRRPLLVENLSAYLSFDAADAMPETDFLATLARRSGCGLLLDLNNLVVNAINEARASGDAHDETRRAVEAACRFVDALPAASIGEIHLAGHCDTASLVIDDHGSRTSEAVWAVYAHTLACIGARPTLIEWDTDLPALDVLLDEAAHATALIGEAAAPDARRAPR
ncbi:MAG TPA: DUF692 domain-containing protein [Methylibium sp.]|uniref:DUF692 domain-containing protein n=1 Tax=Methylibium sp. TaxID=2067992 RepID=UPI002DBB54BD|nr:DUF692 domain-containing protein [Methylibium sp.]HEU4457522.1 DUF692 domain-containing protein [Methylibium sp.]